MTTGGRSECSQIDKQNSYAKEVLSSHAMIAKSGVSNPLLWATSVWRPRHRQPNAECLIWVHTIVMLEPLIDDRSRVIKAGEPHSELRSSRRSVPLHRSLDTLSYGKPGWI